MKTKILLLLLVAASMMGQVRTQNRRVATASTRDSVAYQTTFYFQLGVGEWIQKSDYTKTAHLVRWAKSNATIPIEITGWADKSGTKAINEKLSLRRARTISNYLVRKGIAKERITFKGQGVDAQAENNDKARRADVRGVIHLAIAMESQSEPKEAIPVVQAPPIASVKEEKQEVAKEVETKQVETLVVAETPKSDAQPTQAETPIEKTNKEYNSSRWYVGVGGGVSFGRGTFCSFAADKTRPGFNVGVLGGYKINKLLSAELSLVYTRMALGSYDCCQLLWLASDGNRYAAPIAGMSNYQYNDLRSTTNLFGLGAHLNIDLVSIWSNNSRWSALVSPAIYGVYSSANIKQLSTGKSAMDANSFHFGVGADLGVGYQITPCMGLCLTTGVNYLMGKGIDRLPKEEHKANYVWNSSIKLIFKL